MHLTLKFLGDVPDTETPDICRVVAGRAPNSSLRDHLPRRGGVSRHPAAADAVDRHRRRSAGAVALQAKIEGALKAELGFPKEARRFHPHLTIGRVKHDSPDGRGDLAKLLEKHAHFDADLAVIDEVVIFASFLDRKGPTHEAWPGGARRMTLSTC